VSAATSSQSAQAPAERKATLESFGRALRCEAHTLARRPEITWQQLHNRLQWDGLVEERLSGERERRSAAGSEPWFRTHTPLPESRALIRTLNVGGAFAFNPDGVSLLVLRSGGRLTSLDTKTGAEIRTLELRSRNREATADRGCFVSPDGSFVASASSDDTIRLWDLETGAELHTLEGGHVGPASVSAGTAEWWRLREAADIGPLALPCAVSPDGSFVVAGSDGGALRIWDAATGAELRAVEAHASRITACTVSPDGSLIVSASSDGTVRLWELHTGDLTSLEGVAGVERAALAEDVSSEDPLEDVSRTYGRIAGQVREEFDRGDARHVWDCAVGPDGSFLVLVGGTWIGVWDVSTRRQRWWREHFGQVKGCAVGADGTFIVTAGEGRVLRLWDSETGEIISTLMGHSEPVYASAVSPDGSLIASGANDGVKLWDARMRGERESLESHSDRVTSCTFDPAGGRVASTGADDRLILWSIESRRREQALEGHDDTVQDCAFTPDGSLVVSAGRDDRTVRVWDPETGEELQRLGSDYPVWSCAVSPDGERILSGGLGLMLWDIDTGARVCAYKGHQAEVWCCAFGPDGSWAVSSSGDATVKVWDSQTGAERATLAGHEGVVGVCAVSPDGTFIVSGGADATVRIWDAQRFTERHTLEGHVGQVWGCAVSPDGGFVLSGSWDGTVRAWSAVSGREEARLDLPAAVHGAAFHPAGLLAVCGDLAGSVHFIEVLGLASGPPVVTAREAGDALSFRCPVCRRESRIVRTGLGQLTRCPECDAVLKLNPFVIRRRTGATSRPADREQRVQGLVRGLESASRDEEMMRATKTCLACGHETELLRYARPRCGSAAANSPSVEAGDFMRMRQRRASLHVDRGGMLFQQGRHKEAEEEFGKAIEANPWNATVHGNMGVLMLRRGDLEEAVRWFEKAVEIDPRMPGGQEILAQTRAELAQRGR
jgi:WD40 repeat protein